MDIYLLNELVSAVYANRELESAVESGNRNLLILKNKCFSKMTATQKEDVVILDHAATQLLSRLKALSHKLCTAPSELQQDYNNTRDFLTTGAPYVLKILENRQAELILTLQAVHDTLVKE